MAIIHANIANSFKISIEKTIVLFKAVMSTYRCLSQCRVVTAFALHTVDLISVS